MDERIVIHDNIMFTFRDMVFLACVNEMACVVSENGRIYETLSQWTRTEIKNKFGVSPRFSAWGNVWHVNLMVPIQELRSPPSFTGDSFNDFVTAYFAPVL